MIPEKKGSLKWSAAGAARKAVPAVGRGGSNFEGFGKARRGRARGGRMRVSGGLEKASSHLHRSAWTGENNRRSGSGPKPFPQATRPMAKGRRRNGETRFPSSRRSVDSGMFHLFSPRFVFGDVSRGSTPESFVFYRPVRIVSKDVSLSRENSINFTQKGCFDDFERSVGFSEHYTQRYIEKCKYLTLIKAGSGQKQRPRRPKASGARRRRGN